MRDKNSEHEVSIQSIPKYNQTRIAKSIGWEDGGWKKDAFTSILSSFGAVLTNYLGRAKGEQVGNGKKYFIVR